MRVLLIVLGGIAVCAGSFWGTLKVMDKWSSNGPTDGLIAYWTFDGDEANLKDRSGKGNDAAFLGGTLSASRVAGKLGQALTFDGKGSVVLRSHMAPNSAPELTVAFWVNVRSNPGDYRGIVSAQTSGHDWQEGFNIDLCPEPSISFSCLNIEGAGMPGSWNARKSTTPFGQWVYVVAVIGTGPAGVIVYVNGMAEGKRDRPASLINLDNVRVGARYYSGTSSGHHLDGLVDDVRIYSRAISPEEVMQLYAIGK